MVRRAAAIVIVIVVIVIAAGGPRVAGAAPAVAVVIVFVVPTGTWAHLKQTVLEGKLEPAAFAFNHNGITLSAQQVEHADGFCGSPSRGCSTARRR